MKLFKQLFVLLVLLVLVFPAAAQSYSVNSTTLAGGTNNVPLASTNAAVAIVIPVVRANNVAITASFKLTGAGTTAVVFRLDESVDGSTWESSAHSLSVTPAGTTTVVGVGNVAVNGIGYLRLQTIENPNATSVTNLVFKYGFKSGL